MTLTEIFYVLRTGHLLRNVQGDQKARNVC